MNSTMKPLVLIDIDGVCNAFDAFAVNRPLPAHQRRTEAGGYTVVLDNRHPAWMATLEDRADVRWATMWQAQAATHFAPIAGFGEDWDFIDFDRHHEFTGQRMGYGVVNYKWPGILATVGQDQPLVYVDDDMDPKHHDWARFRNSLGVPTLFVQPDPRYGFTRAQYNEVIDFLDHAVTLEPALI